jgi:hypothetical protein
VKPLLAILFGLLLIALAMRATMPPSPVFTIDLLCPTNGSMVSNTITLCANPFSSFTPIARVEYWLDGTNLIATVTNPIAAPFGLTLTPLTP